MDINAILHFVVTNNDKVIGALVALFLLTSILLLVRNIGDKSESAGGGSDVDIKAIEGAMRKVLSSQPVSVAAGTVVAAPVVKEGEEAPAPSSAADAEQAAAMAAAVAERESKIAELQAALEQAKAASAAGAASSGGSPDAELVAKLEEAQARLAEYEIIEDDIADLSLYKEENARLKGEVETLKKQLEDAAAVASSAPAASSAPKIASGDEAVLKFEKADKFELDPNDDIMKAFAEAVEEKTVTPPPAAFSLPQEEIDAMVRETAAPSTETATTEASVADVEDPQAKIDALFSAAGSESASSDAPEVVQEVAPAPAPAAVDPQAEIDALFAAAAESSAAPTPEAKPTPAAALDPQAEIDALFAAAAESTPQPAAAPEPAVPAAQDDAQSEIDRLLAEAAASELKPIDDPQKMADAMLAGALDEAKPAEAASGEDEIDPLAGLLATDTEKMLSEVERLGAADVQEDADALAESLDTDKLLAEVSSLEEQTPGDKKAEDDLLAEFKDAEKGGS